MDTFPWEHLPSAPLRQPGKRVKVYPARTDGVGSAQLSRVMSERQLPAYPLKPRYRIEVRVST